MTYLPEIAATLHNLGILQAKQSESTKALKSYTEALDISRELALSNPLTYLPDVAGTLNNLGNLQAERSEHEEALKLYTEALKIYQELARSNPLTYLPDVAMTLFNLSSYYQTKRPDHKLSVKFALETIKIVLPLYVKEKTLFTQKYLKSAVAVLLKWGMDKGEIEDEVMMKISSDS